MRLRRLAILSTHPIQYQAPWFRALASQKELEIKVFYCHKATSKEQAAAGFGVEFDWDTPLLEGYPHHFLNNIAASPSIGTFRGLDTPEIAEIIRQRQYDVVLVNGWHYKSAWQAIKACWRTKIPVMVRSDSHLNTPRRPLQRVFKQLVHGQFIPRMDACLAAGKWSRDYFLYYGARADRIFLVPHIIDESRFNTGTERLDTRVTEIRRKWELAIDACVFLFVGKFVDNKRPMDFVQAVETAHRKNCKVAGLMVGDGPLFTSCQSYVTQQNLPIHFTGFLNQSEIVDAYIGSDALVLPSTSETWGLVVNEAMTCGKAAIVSDQVGCGPDLIISDKTGDKFPRGDVNYLSDIIFLRASDPAKLRFMGEQAKELLKKFSVDSAVVGVLQAIKTVLN